MFSRRLLWGFGTVPAFVRNNRIRVNEVFGTKCYLQFYLFIYFRKDKIYTGLGLLQVLGLHLGFFRNTKFTFNNDLHIVKNT